MIPDLGAAAPLSIADIATTKNGAETEVAVVVEPVVAEPVAEVSSVYTGLTTEQAALPEQDQIVQTFIDIPDTELEAPVITSTSPNVATASIRSAPAEEPATNWLVWLAGAGVALFGLLLFFGRLVRDRFGSSPIGAMAPRERRIPESSARTLDVVSEIEVAELGSAEREAAFDDLEDTQENVALDADLIIGSGLQEGSEVDVAQDFGFAAGTELDLELPEEMSSGGLVDAGTDIIPPLNVEMASILESEVMPDEVLEDDDYDMSVIVDATKMPSPDDVTHRDLEAVAVKVDDETLITENYTMNSDVDYNVLEQDYEDEFTATQALSNEIARAAEDLAIRMDDDKDPSMASVAALDVDVTAQLPAGNDDFVDDLDDTGINEAVAVNMKDADSTVEMPSKKRGRSA